MGSKQGFYSSSNNSHSITVLPRNMSHLSPSAIFSPSVARQQQAAAKDWNYIDNWLSSKFNGKTPPPFERNNDTLKALLALAAHQRYRRRRARLTRSSRSQSTT